VQRPPRRLSRRLVTPLLLGVGVLVLSGCSVPTFGFPTHVATVQSHRVVDIWKWSCVAALTVGAFVLALILYAPIAYRRRNDEMPRQVRYNLPIEALYTVVPFVIIAALFYYTARDETYEDKEMPHAKFVAAKGLAVDVLGFKWNWQFTYSSSGSQNIDLQSTGTPQRQAQLVLPVGRPVRFDESSADVIHSFWVPAFAFKRDVIPGRTNSFEVTPDRPGTYAGRCAELCGYQHDRMDFTVTVVPAAQFDAMMGRYLADPAAAAAAGLSSANATSAAAGGTASTSATGTGGSSSDRSTTTQGSTP